MPRSLARSCAARTRSSSLFRDPDKRIVCNCGWELRLGYGVAVSLAIFEAKRFCLLALELFLEWQVIRIAGGYLPVVLTFVDITLGFPCALAAVYAIRKRKGQKYRARTRKIFGYLFLTISACAILNVATMASIGYHVSVRQRAIASVFNASMHLYVTKTSHKYAVDQIQYVLQCCGHASYTDWFLFDWQMVDYASREDMSRQSRISDEIYRHRGVPFSCCNLRVLRPCAHFQMTENDAETVNDEGCAGILSSVLVRIVFVAYTMTTMLVLTQALLAFFVARIANKTRGGGFSSDFSHSSEASNGSSRPLVESASPASSEEYSTDSRRRHAPKRGNVRGIKKNSKNPAKTCKCSTGSGRKRSIKAVNKNRGSGAVVSGSSDVHEDTPSFRISPGKQAWNEAARIKPSIHAEHRVPKKKPGIIKRLR